MEAVRKIGELDCTFVNEKTKPKAVVILCHGFGAPGTDLVPVGTELVKSFPSLADVTFVFPQAPIELDPYFDSRAWWMIDIEKIQSLVASGEYREMRNSKPPELESRRKDLSTVIEFAMEEYEMPAAKIVLGGFSQGSMLATETALNYPDNVGALIVWSGTLLNETEWTAAAAQKAPLSVVQSHGRLDPVLPFAGAEYLRDMLSEQGHKVDFVPFKGQHTIGNDAMQASLKAIDAVVDA